ncbi:PP195 [Orf virus]|uniref:PP195 n=1 Tax=Orf virus TaxID=10258 RepID=F1AX37_ORFV|nr:PP195 [Orf virus]
MTRRSAPCSPLPPSWTSCSPWWSAARRSSPPRGTTTTPSRTDARAPRSSSETCASWRSSSTGGPAASRTACVCATGPRAPSWTRHWGSCASEASTARRLRSARATSRRTICPRWGQYRPRSRRVYNVKNISKILKVRVFRGRPTNQSLKWRGWKWTSRSSTSTRSRARATTTRPSRRSTSRPRSPAADR